MTPQAPLLEPGGADLAGADVTGGPMPRETLLARTLVELADTLVADFDVVELLTLVADRCVELLEVGGRRPHVAGARRRTAGDGLLQRGYPRLGTVRAAVQGRPLPGLLPQWQAGVGP